MFALGCTRAWRSLPCLQCGRIKPQPYPSSAPKSVSTRPPVARTVNMTAREIQLLRIGSDLRSGCPIIWPAAGTLAGDSCPASLPLTHPHGRTQWRTRSGGNQQGEKHYDQEDHDQHGIGINHGPFLTNLNPRAIMSENKECQGNSLRELNQYVYFSTIPYLAAELSSPRTRSQSASRVGQLESASSVCANPTPCGPRS